MNLNSQLYRTFTFCMLLSVFFVPVLAENETVDNGNPGSVGLSNNQPVIITPSETPTPAIPLVTLEPTPVPTTIEVTIEPTIIPTVQETSILTPVPTVIPTMAMVTAEPTAIPTNIVVTVEPTATPTIAPTTQPTVVGTTNPTTIEVTIEPTIIPTVQETSIPTPVPTVIPTMAMVTAEPTAIPTNIVVTVEPTMGPQVNVSPIPTLVIDNLNLNETPIVTVPVVTPSEQSLVVQQGNLTETGFTENNLTIVSPSPVICNTTPGLIGTSVYTPELNVTGTSADTVGQTGNNYTWSDPPLNTSANNPYYYNNAGWVINIPGHEWVMDLNTSHNTGSGVTLSGNTFSGFGSGFAILINTPNVIFDGMGAILNGNNATSYGIIVQNSPANDINTVNGPLGGISITNITLTGFREAGIFFNNVIGNRPGEIVSKITNVHADSNNVTFFPDSNSGNGIVLQDSQYVEVSNSTANNNGDSGITLWSSSNNNLLGNTATGNNYGFYLSTSDSNILSGNTASGNEYGFELIDSNFNTLSGNTALGNNWSGLGLYNSHSNTLSGNNASGSTYDGFWLTDSDANTLTGNTASGNNGYGFQIGGSNNILSSNTASLNNYSGFLLVDDATLNTLTGNTASENNGYGFLLVDDSTSNTLTGNTASWNNYSGFLLYNSASNTLSGNTGFNNNRNGFDLYDSNSNTLSGNTASGNTDGFSLYDSTLNTLSGNTASENDWSGFFLYNSTFNALYGNTASGNFNGFDLQTNSDSNNLIYNIATGNGNQGFFLYNSTSNTLTGNTASGNNEGFDLWDSTSNTLYSNIASGNNVLGFALSNSTSNTLSGNIIIGSYAGLFLTDNRSRNTIYNNYFNNAANVFVDSSSTGTIWNVAPRPGTNIVGGPNLGGNFWAAPDGTGWSQTHPNIGGGFTIPYNVTDDGLNIDNNSLSIWIPTPNPSPSPSGSYSVTISPFPPVTLPYDSEITANNIPANMEPGHSYTVGLTVKNTGTTNWSSGSGVALVSSSLGGFIFNPARSPIPEGVVIQPGESYTFPVEITVPYSIESGTYQLRFSLMHSLKTQSGQLTVPFGNPLINKVNVGTPAGMDGLSGIKMGAKAPAQSTTFTGNSTGYASRQFTRGISGTTVKRPVIATHTLISTPSAEVGFRPGISREQAQRYNLVNTTVIRKFDGRPAFYG